MICRAVKYSTRWWLAGLNEWTWRSGYDLASLWSEGLKSSIGVSYSSVGAPQLGGSKRANLRRREIDDFGAITPSLRGTHLHLSYPIISDLL